jgi:glycosyltransferase involved in cell wall biosynthesis
MSITNDLNRALRVFRQGGWSAVRRKLGRRMERGGEWAAYAQDALDFAGMFDFTPQDVAASRAAQAAHPGPLEIRSITWLLPEFSHAYYGGIYTLLRFAAYFAIHYKIQNRFAILGGMDPGQAAAQIAAAFPALADAPVRSFASPDEAAAFEPTDAGIATLWGTAYALLRMNQVKRKFYFLQDYEPLFYPAGSIFAQAEATYRFGFHAIANTPSIASAYRDYGGTATHFYPAIDADVFYPPEQRPTGGSPADPWRVFFYARPGHPRNGFELGAQALLRLKERLGGRVEILAAGGNWKPGDYGLGGVVENLGLMEYRHTADLYRACHAGLVMMFTRHPSYLPLELMACGSLVVTNANPATAWLLKDGYNARLAQPGASWIAGVLAEALSDEPSRLRITRAAADQVAARYADWATEIRRIYSALCAAPEAAL